MRRETTKLRLTQQFTRMTLCGINGGPLGRNMPAANPGGIPRRTLFIAASRGGVMNRAEIANCLLHRNKVAWVISLCVGFILVSNGCHRHEITYRIILPDQYVGWVRVDFEGKTAPALDPNNVMTFTIGKDGRCQSRSLM